MKRDRIRHGVNLVALVAVGAAASWSCGGRAPLGDDPTNGVHSGLLQAGTVTVSVPLPPGTPLSAVSVAGSSTVLFGSNVHVTEEVSGSAVSTIVNSSNTSTTTQTGVVLAANLWSVGNVFLSSNTNVAGSITTAGTVTQQTGVTVGGPITQHATLTPVPTTITVTFPASSTDLILQPGQTASRGPGAFGTVTVNSRATLTLSSGTYFIDSLDIEPQGVIALTGAGPFVINVRSNFMAKGQFTLPAVSPAPTFVLVDAGTSDVFLQAEFDGTLIAPNANMTLAAIGTASYHGAFFGKSVTLQAGVNLVHRGAGAGTVSPIAECVITQPDGTFKAVFGYNASNVLGNLTVPLGANNTFLPSPANRGQPTVFKPGRQRAQFLVPFDGRALTWTLDGASTTASAVMPECTAACVQHLVDPTKPRIDTPLATPAPVLSVDESKVMRDTYRWQDTLPVPESFSDGTPRLYYTKVFLDSDDAVQTMDFLRIHYTNTPLFETEMAAFEAQGILNKFSHPFDGSGRFTYALIPGAMFNVMRQQALDPTTPSEILRAMPFQPIPSSDLGLAPQASCGLAPITQCVAQASNGSLRAVFSYNNPAGNPVTIPVGADNAITGGPAGTLPIEAFAAGQHNLVFAVSIPTGATVRWTLNGQVASASASTVRCTAAQIAQIGVDSFNPFPTPAQASCRFATPAEGRFPLSKLPPAARANTCITVAYNYLGTLGFQWRGVDNDADDAAGLAADAAFALGASAAAAPAAAVASTTAGTVQTVKAALFGKLFRKAVQFVKNVGNTVVDAGRRGLRAVAGLFLGSTNVQITVDPQYTDTSFVAGTQTQAWGAGFGKPISLEGLEVRANRSVFLSVAHLDSNNHAQVKVLNHLSGARICYRTKNGAGFVTDAFTADDICPNQSVTTSNPNPPPMQVKQEEINVMAQLTDARKYMTNVGKFTNSGAEVIVGYAANAIGKIQGISNSMNKNRAFTPCLGFSWSNEVEIYLELIAAAATTTTFDYVDKKVTAFTKQYLTKVSLDLQNLINQQAALATLSVQNAGTALGAQIDAAKAVVDDAVNKLSAARDAATVLKQEGDDFARAATTAARAVVGNNPAVQAAENAAQQTINNLNAQVTLVTTTSQTASMAVTAASAAVANLAVQAAGTTAAASINAVRDSLDLLVSSVTTVAPPILGAIAGTVSAMVVNGIIQVLGGIIAEVFEFAAGGDILLPAASGDHTNLLDRGVSTHEYGHFTLCNLLENTAPAAFPFAYDDAAVQGIVTGQAPTAIGAVLNESFADLITSQVVAGTNYATPTTNVLPSAGGTSYCVAAATGCIEDNFKDTNPPTGSSFTGNVLRTVGLFTDAFDGSFLIGLPGDVPMNGNAWQAGISLAAKPGLDAKDEVVNLAGLAYRDWISHAMGVFNLIRQDNFFAGLSDAMIDQNFNWCARCQVFGLHTIDGAGNALCPTEWVGQRPTFNTNGNSGTLTCAFEGCPPGTTVDNVQQTCDPPCPPDEHFDAFQLICVENIIVP